MTAALERSADDARSPADRRVRRSGGLARLSDYDVHDILYRLCDWSVELFDVDAAGVLVLDRQGEMRLFSASSRSMAALELFELQHTEGPCFDAYREGRQVTCNDIATADRWPRFGPRALETGFRATFAFPLRLRQRSIGAMNLFRSAPGPLGEADLRAAQALADIATVGILQERAIRDAEQAVGQLQRALDSRVVIERAKGILAERLGLDVATAFHLLRNHARRGNRRLYDVAQQMVDGTLHASSLLEGS